MNNKDMLRGRKRIMNQYVTIGQSNFRERVYMVLLALVRLFDDVTTIVTLGYISTWFSSFILFNERLDDWVNYE